MAAQGTALAAALGQGKNLSAYGLATALGVTVPPEVQQFWQRAERVAKRKTKRQK